MARRYTNTRLLVAFFPICPLRVALLVTHHDKTGSGHASRVTVEAIGLSSHPARCFSRFVLDAGLCLGTERPVLGALVLAIVGDRFAQGNARGAVDLGLRAPAAACSSSASLRYRGRCRPAFAPSAPWHVARAWSTRHGSECLPIVIVPFRIRLAL